MVGIDDMVGGRGKNSNNKIAELLDIFGYTIFHVNTIMVLNTAAVIAKSLVEQLWTLTP